MKYKFNLNHHIKVKLTDLGYQHMANRDNRIFEYYQDHINRDIDYYKTKADSDGYTKFQMWEFIQIFGSVTMMGMQKYFEMDILIDSEDLKQI